MNQIDWTEIVTAGIAALGAVGGSALMQSKATAVLQVKLDALRNDVDTLSRRVDKHNNLIDRMTIAECKIKELESEVQRNEKS